jgi:hypothetical protein
LTSDKSPGLVDTSAHDRNLMKPRTARRRWQRHAKPSAMLTRCGKHELQLIVSEFNELLVRIACDRHCC